nr:hypothetical protein [Nocardia albiluteola]
MTDTTKSQVRTTRHMLSKVPEVTMWFWIIKILCTTVGESFADWINNSLGVGLVPTALIFTVVLAAVLGWQLRLDRYVPLAYWLSVVVLSVTGTLYTDILTDQLNVPLALSTSVFAVVLAVVFGIWFARERTLSIHSIVTLPRELFYWLAVLVTFALGTAVGDWTLAATGWGPGTSVLLPAGLIVAIVLGWRLGANAVLSFWLAYILTRPLGANLGDWLASPTADHGLGLGTALTSVIFLVAILATVGYLTRTRGDVIADRPTPVPANPGQERAGERPMGTVRTAPGGAKRRRERAGERPMGTVRTAPDGAKRRRERIMLGYYAIVAILVAVLLGWAAGQPHATPSTDEEAAPASAPQTPGQAIAHFPPAEVANFRTITRDTLVLVQTGKQPEAKARIKDLETAWDKDQDTLQSLDQSGWTVVDGRIDSVLKAIRSSHPDSATETGALDALLGTLG